MNENVEVESSTEFRKIEEICFNKDIVWKYNGRNHKNGMSCFPKVIKIEDKFIISEGYPTTENTITFNQFIEKYDTGKLNVIYRFKTKKEFIDEFGINWRDKLKKHFNYEMDYLLGRKLTKFESRELIGHNHIVIPRKFGSYSWNISSDMITKCINNESKTNKIYRIKTKEEFLKEFGQNWRNLTDGASFVNEMDYLFGKKITTEKYNEFKNDYKIYLDGFIINKSMITKSKPKFKQTEKSKYDFELINSLYKKTKPNLVQDNTEVLI